MNAIGLTLDEEWNAATKYLITVGAKVLAVSYQKGGRGSGLSELDVPRFGPFHRSLGYSELEEAAREIPLADLLAA